MTTRDQILDLKRRIGDALTARADIGGFGAGADLSWQVNAGIGFQLSRSIFSEITYRAYDVNYNHGGLDYGVLTHGVEVTTGINF